MLDEIDVGFPASTIGGILETHLAYTLFQSNIGARAGYADALQFPAEFSTTEPVLLVNPWFRYTIRYTLPGPYTFIVRLDGQPVPRERLDWHIHVEH